VEHLSKNKIKWIRSLRLKKNRDSESIFVVEGDKMVREIIENWSDQIVLLCTTNTSYSETKESYIVDLKTMKELSTLHTPSNFLVVVKQPKFDQPNGNFILAIDGVQDPGNMGTIIRTADWFGVDQIVCSHETVDIFNSKVIQSSMGSIFRVPVTYTDLNEYLSSTSLPIFGALLEGKNMYESSIGAEGIILMGNEGNGISESLRPLISEPILIPGKGAAESLNVAVATAVILAEFARKN
jgi:TrmH family RNA methyltransferase